MHRLWLLGAGRGHCFPPQAPAKPSPGRGLASGMGAATHCPRASRGLGVVRKPNPPVPQPLPTVWWLGQTCGPGRHRWGHFEGLVLPVTEGPCLGVWRNAPRDPQRWGPTP